MEQMTMKLLIAESQSSEAMNEKTRPIQHNNMNILLIAFPEQFIQPKFMKVIHNVQNMIIQEFQHYLE
jgi:hypothetical protein